MKKLPLFFFLFFSVAIVKKNIYTLTRILHEYFDLMNLHIKSSDVRSVNILFRVSISTHRVFYSRFTKQIVSYRVLRNVRNIHWNRRCNIFSRIIGAIAFYARFYIKSSTAFLASRYGYLAL